MTDRNEGVIDDRSPVRLGLTIMIIVAVASGIGSQIWWASRTTYQLEVIERDLSKIQTQQNTEGKLLVERIEDLKNRVFFMETRGSPAVTPRLDALEKGVEKMREDFELHKAVLMNTK